jgi:hypothetical protein
MAAGAIPPPLFFEQRRSGHFGSRAWHPQERRSSRTHCKYVLNKHNVDHTI